MFFIMVRDMRGLFLPYGFLSNRASVGGSVARASEAKVSIIRLTHNICTAFRGESCGDKAESYIFPRKIIVAIYYDFVWSCVTASSAEDRILKYTDLWSDLLWPFLYFLCKTRVTGSTVIWAKRNYFSPVI